MSNTPELAGASPTERCPLCGKPALAAEAPFCSPRCRNRDLIQWLDGGYRMPGRPLTEGDESSDGGPDG